MPSNRIYAVLAESDPKMVKFGTSVNPGKRLASLQTGSPVRLSMIGHIESARSLEGKVHNSLRYLRSHGEWFAYRDEAIEVADLIAAGNLGLLNARLLEIQETIYQSALDVAPDKPSDEFWVAGGGKPLTGDVIRERFAILCRIEDRRGRYKNPYQREN